MYKTKNNPPCSHATPSTTNSPLPNHHPITATASPPLPPPPDHHHLHQNHPICSHGHAAAHRSSCPPPHTMFSQPIMLAFTSWLNTRRSRCVFLLLCSPLLIPFLCASFPFLCAAEFCFYLCRHRRDRWKKKKKKKKTTSPSHLDNQGIEEEEQLQRCEEGRCGCGCGDQEVRLLQRYLEDQLRLVGSVVYECGDDFFEYTPSLDSNINTPLLG